MGAYGLAWAQSIVAMVEVFILFVIMARRTSGLFGLQFWAAVGRMASATGFTAIVCYIMVLLLPLQATDQSIITTFPKFCVIAFVSLSAYVVFSKLLQLEEANPVIRMAKRLLFNRVFVRPQR